MEIKRNCKSCDGTGEIEHGTGDIRICYSCKGVGWVDRGEIKNATNTLDERITDIEDKLNDLIVKCNDIFEKVNE